VPGKLGGLWSGPPPDSARHFRDEFDFRPGRRAVRVRQGRARRRRTLRFGFRSRSTVAVADGLAYRNGGYSAGGAAEPRPQLVDRDRPVVRFAYRRRRRLLYIDARASRRRGLVVLDQGAAGAPQRLTGTRRARGSAPLPGGFSDRPRLVRRDGTGVARLEKRARRRELRNVTTEGGGRVARAHEPPRASLLRCQRAGSVMVVGGGVGDLGQRS